MNSWLTSLLSLALLGLASCAPFQKVRPTLYHEQWVSYDGKQMPWKEWPVAKGDKVKSVVIAVHGLSGASSDFWLLGERLPPKGIALYAYDLRGQGKDPDTTMRGDILKADKWLRDLITFHRLVRERHPRAPIIWYGESLGSLIALHTAAWERKGAPDALILASPVAGLRVQIGELERFLIRTTSFALPSIRVKLGDLAGVDESKVRVTSQTTHGTQMQKTPHHVESFTLRLLREVDAMIQQNERAADRIDIPVLVLASPHDIIATPDQVQTLFKDIDSSDKRLHWYTRSYHLLLHDVQHEKVVSDVTRWLDKQSHELRKTDRRREASE